MIIYIQFAFLTLILLLFFVSLNVKSTIAKSTRMPFARIFQENINAYANMVSMEILSSARILTSALRGNISAVGRATASIQLVLIRVNVKVVTRATV